jgi:Zn-finger nucleic acid-binding protein
MKCPTDSATLVMSERNGIEIDYCPDCRGVWLDRGELDKIIDRAGAASPPPAPSYQQQQPPQYRETSYNPGYGQQPYRKKKDNWLSELFD